MALIVLQDSYPTTNQDAVLGMSGATYWDGGCQSFVATQNNITKVTLYCYRSGNSPSGNAYVKIYNPTGAAPNLLPTGAALGTSDAVAESSVHAGLPCALIDFNFSTPVTGLTPGNSYVLTLEFSGGDGSNMIYWGGDSSSPSHAGNGGGHIRGGAWSSFGNTQDQIFYVYGEAMDYGAMLQLF